MCDVARLQREVVSAARCIAELTLGLGEVVFEHLTVAGGQPALVYGISIVMDCAIPVR